MIFLRTIPKLKARNHLPSSSLKEHRKYQTSHFTVSAYCSADKIAVLPSPIRKRGKESNALRQSLSMSDLFDKYTKTDKDDSSILSPPERAFSTPVHKEEYPHEQKRAFSLPDHTDDARMERAVKRHGSEGDKLPGHLKSLLAAFSRTK